MKRDGFGVPRRVSGVQETPVRVGCRLGHGYHFVAEIGGTEKK